MRILIVVATEMEWTPFAKAQAFDHRGHRIQIVSTGVGMVRTAVWATRSLALIHYDLALNFGVCGSFDPALAPGSVVHVVADRISELGAEDGATFLDMQALEI